MAAANKPARGRGRPPKTVWQKRFGSRKFRRFYVASSLAILTVTSIVWSWLSASVQLQNADQLVDGYLFESPQTFQQAYFPNTHTFLLKWPLFMLLKLASFESWAFTSMTVAISMVTIGALVYILWRIERRGLQFGTLCLALASALWLVPAVPYAGGLLPVNLAMITTRNLEYITYIVVLVLIIKTPRLRSRQTAAAVSLMTLLIVTDRLFMSLLLGSAVVLAVIYGVRRRELLRLPFAMAVVAITSAAISLVAVKLINVVGITDIVGESVASPYGLTGGFKDLILATLYAGLGLLTNFGANAGFDGLTLVAVVRQAFNRIIMHVGIGYIVNLALLVGAFLMVWRLLKQHLSKPPVPKTKLRAVAYAYDRPAQLAVTLLASSLVAVGLFIVADHYYPVDARYLAIGFFAVPTAVATFSRGLKVDDRRAVAVGLISILSIIVSIPVFASNYNSQQQVLRPIGQRNKAVAVALEQRKIDVLVGDYWRVLPIRQEARSKQAVLPLADCTTPRQTLSSKHWERNLQTTSFAYLLSYDKGLTDYPRCNLETVLQTYGTPNASVIISGTADKPEEQLLIFDKGKRQVITSGIAPTKIPGTVRPVNLDQISSPSCFAGTVFQVVAHQDDDILFMNPQLSDDIRAGKCIETVYVTAGDNGQSEPYWLGREQGSQAAYNKMFGFPDDSLWIEKLVRLPSGAIVTMAHPETNQRVNLVSMRLPDGGLQGKGFKATGYQSLSRLEAGLVKRIVSVDGQSTYNVSRLRSDMTALMKHFEPTTVRTQANVTGSTYMDHSDHLAVSRLVRGSYDAYRTKNNSEANIEYFVGYPIRERAINLSSDQTEEKTQVFLNYAKHDGAVCHDFEECLATGTYGSYLQRQYQSDY